MKRLLKNSAIFVIFGAIYFFIEWLWKGHPTHWTMYVLGGWLGLIIGNFNEVIPWEWSFRKQCIYGMGIVTLAEGLTGLLLNKMLQLNIWNYSHTWGHFFFDQCCIPFSLAWLVLSAACILLDDLLRWKLFGEEKPHYKF